MFIQGSPTPITGYMATAAKTARVFSSLMMILSRALESSHVQWSEVMQVIASTYHGLWKCDCTRTDQCKADACPTHSIAHAGYALVGLSAGSTGGVFQLLQFYLFALHDYEYRGFWWVIAYFERYRDLDLTELRQLCRTWPIKQPLMGVLLTNLFLFFSSLLEGSSNARFRRENNLVFAAAVQSQLITYWR